MFKVSEGFKKEINKLQGRKFNAKVIIRNKEYSGNQIYEMNLEESVNPSDNFSIGTVCSNTFEIKLINTGDIFDNAIVKPYVGLYIGDDIEYIPLGVFTVIKTSVKGKFINLECVDNMLGLEKVYFSDLSYPADINDIAKEICKKAGVNLASKLPNYRVNKIEGYSLREAIGFIASLCGSFARFNRIGDLEIRGYEVVKQEMTPHNLFKLDIEANECIIKKVIAKKGEEELSTGTDDGNKIVFNNPIITKEILSDIYTKYKEFKYIPYTAKWKGNPAIMAGDILNLTDLKGNKYNALIMEQKFTYKNGISSEVKAKGKTRQDSSFDSKGSVTQSMERYSIEQANIKKALIDKASINDLTAVDAKIQRLYTDDLTAIRADIVTLNSQKANIIELNSVRADLQEAIIGKANITDLNAAVGKINVLESKTASIENALAGNLTADNFKTNAITAGSAVIAEGAIGSSQISSLSVNKLEAGDITTSKHRIVSADGTIEIVGNQILINRNNVNRVVLGEYRKSDGTTEYGLLVRAKDGQTIMLDGNGVHNAGITDGAIDNNKVADNANISGNKLDINSVIREVNTHGTETIKGTKVQIGDRTLDVELSTQKNTITEHSKELSSQKAAIQALDSAIKLKVDSQTFTQSTITINNNINRAKEEAINTANSNTSNIINNLDIGVENLLSDSNKIVGESSDREFIQFADIAPIIDKYGLVKYTISFDIKSKDISKCDIVNCYCQNGSATKYSIGYNPIKVTRDFKRVSITVIPTRGSNNETRAMLAFYGTYDTGNIPVIKNVKIELGQFATTYSLSEEDLKKYSDEIAKAKADLAQANAIANADGKITEEERKRIQQAQENLNTAIARADKAKADAKAYSDTLGQQLKANAEKYANDVAVAKSELVKQESKAYADGIVTAEEKKRIDEARKNLDTAIAKATEAETKAKSYADSKKQEAIKVAENLALEKSNLAKKYAEDVATAKANLAKTEAIANADGKISAEEQKRIQQAQENLNTAISKADKAKQDAILEANRVAELKKQEAINSANSHADSKANEVLNSAKAFVNVEITTVNSHLNKAASEINVLKKQIELKVGQSDIDKSIQNIEFGGRNLFLKSKGPFKSSNEYVGISITSVVEKYLNRKITISADVKANKVGKIRFYSLGGYSVGFWVERDVTTEWTRIKATGKFTLNDEKQKWCDLSFYGNYGSGLFTEVRNVKIELGELASDYTEAPEDTDKLIIDNIKTVTDKITTVESKFTQENNSIKASVQDLNSTTQSITTNVSNINRDLTSKINSNLDVAKTFATDIATNKANTAKQEAISSANSHADNIAASKADEALNNAKAYTNAEITTINSKVHNVESGINILKDKINSKVSQSDIDKSISEIKLGGRNLILKSDVELEGTSPKDIQVGKLSDTQFITGKTVTVSLDLECEDLNGGNRVGYEMALAFEDGSTQYIGCWYYVGSSPKTFNGRISSVWNVKKGRIINIHYSGLYIQCSGKKIKIGRPKIELGNKATDWSPAPEDLNQSIADNIKIVDSKISDVSSSVTQLRDSVTIDIRAINSKTQSIETTLNGKASKQEVTEVNNRVATIKASLDGITQRVSATESKTQTLETNLNGKASKQEVNNVSSKVVSLETNLNGITNRVSNTESRINTLDGKVASAVTNQQFTEFKQSNDKFKFTVEQRSSVSNILPNGSFFGGDRGWLHNGSEFWAGAYSGYGFKGRITGAIKNRAAYNNPERYLQTHKAYKVKKNTTYTINFHYICEKNVQSMDAFVVLSNTEYGDYAQPLCILTAQGGSQSNVAEEKPFTYKFNTGNHEWVWLRFDHNGMKSGVNWDEFCWIYVSEVGIYEGDVGAVKWTPKGGEVYSANYQMDGLGFKGTFEDGTYASLGKDGLEWYNAGTGHAYHALTYVTSFDIPVGNPGKAYIKLPAEFTKRRSSLKWTVALRGYYYSTSGNFFPFHVHCTGARDYIENGLVVCEVQGLCKIQNGSNSGDVQFRPLTAMLIAIA